MKPEGRATHPKGMARWPATVRVVTVLASLGIGTALLLKLAPF